LPTYVITPHQRHTRRTSRKTLYCCSNSNCFYWSHNLMTFVYLFRTLLLSI